MTTPEGPRRGPGRPKTLVRVCTVPDCDRPVLARGFCSRHYYTAKRNDTPKTIPIQYGRKLTADEVLQIRELSGKHSDRALAAQFNTSHHNISNIRRGLAWAHTLPVGDPPIDERPRVETVAVERVRCANLRCGEEFDRARRGRRQKYCSVKCSRQAYEDRHKRTSRISKDELRRLVALLLCEVLVEAGIIAPDSTSVQRLHAIIARATTWRHNNGRE